MDSWRSVSPRAQPHERLSVLEHLDSPAAHRRLLRAAKARKAAAGPVVLRDARYAPGQRRAAWQHWPVLPTPPPRRPPARRPDYAGTLEWPDYADR
jgi:hypothetical protein